MYVVDGDGFLRSDDGGETWRSLEGLGGTYRAAVIDPSNPDVVYVGSTHKGVLKTTDGGHSWRQVNDRLTNPSINELAIDPANPQTIYAATDGGAFVSVDGGENWSPIQKGMGPNPVVYSIGVDPNDPSQVYAATPDGIFRLVSAPPEAAADSPSEQARAFAEPILAAIADRAPDFEDDFSTTDKGWGLDQFEITDGVALATLVDGNIAGLSPPWLVAKDFVLSFDSRQVSGSYSSEQIVNLGLPGGFLKFGITSGTRNWGAGKGQFEGEQHYPVADGGGDVVRPIGETNHTLVVARGPRLAIYLNDDPIIYVEDKDFDAAHDVWFMCHAQPDIVCEFDNVKLWNLENVPGLPEAEATPAPSPAATILAHWPLDGDLKDGSGNGYDLQQTGENLDFVPGCFGQAIQFNDDATSYLTRGQDDAAFDFGSSDYSVELWGKFDRAPSETHEQTLIEKCTGGGCSTTGWGATATTTLWRFIHNPGTHVVVDSPPLFWQSGNWYHMVAVRQGETVYLYINGEQVASGWASDIADNDAPLILGRRFDESQLFPLIGALDEVTIYEGALSAAEVRDYYQQGASCAGAAVTPAPGSPADQARAFAEPILAAIAERAPDFEDDFSTADERWNSNCGEQGSHTDHFEIADGVARMTLSEESDAYLAHNWFTFKNFVLSLDSRQVSGSYVSGQIVHLGIPNGDFTLNVESGTKTWGLFKAQQDQWSPPLQEGGGDVVSPIGETNHIIVVARGPRLTFYLNDEPIAYIEDKDFDVAHGTFFMCSGQPDIVCEFDNVKLWNLDNVPGLPEAEAIPSTQPTATPTPNPLAEQAHAFAEPILAAIAERAPDFEDDFSIADEGWDFGAQGPRTGNFEITEGVARMTLSEGSDAYLARDRFVFKNFVLMLDSRQVSGSYGSGQTVCLDVLDGPLTLNITSGTRTWSTHKHQGDQVYYEPEGSGDVVSPIGEATHIFVVARGPRVAYYLNDVPIVYIEDKDFDVGHKIFFMCSGQPDIVCEFDNIKLWNLDDVPGLP